ncbi:Cof-type HAD-IIB family hydrolase [Paludicola sp. MB14-C6]|uniref:Cof-type HAD-IIB family hydrolase n=1 Tax=Paludihabitans sp. MB14-C6 TaxID=3070656 RepID=UPI0027DB319B|nr:Cof-type HAD-IIB family hydrolase [Paludicola sp. MB14-C6]WMJ23117.1 Cof-type HAD-IIB family hydrolase [Paludicola sp. MB14-C6]
MRVKDITLVSDLDGTIVPISGIVSEKNKQAIKKFQELGGTFAVATGRSPISAKSILEALDVDGIIIANNGALIYDIKNKKSLWCKYLEPSYKQVVAYAKHHYPNVGIELITDDGRYYIASSNERVAEIIRGTNFSVNYVEEKDYPDCCCKVLFVPNDDEFRPFVEDMLNQRFEDMEFVESGGNCFEMMASGISKGYPFERLIGFYNKKLSDSAAIGDYYNDVEMLKKAAIGAAVENAVKDVKKAANIIVKSCEDDGLADFIDYLINNSEK